MSRRPPPGTAPWARVLRRTAWILPAIALVLTVGPVSCAGPGYYWQAARGHLELVRERKPVDEVLADPSTDAQQAERLRLAQAMLDFAGTSLALPVEDQYSSYVATGRDAVVWNVIVAPEFSLEARRWCFPVAGCVPYRGYFDEAQARRFADRQRSRGNDVSVQPVSAYSTLGWFSDPLLDTMLKWNEARLASTVFHELAHLRVYVKGDTTFSESYASFVGQEGTRQWLQDQGRPQDLAAWQERTQSFRRVRELMATARQRLAALYDSDMPAPAMRVEKAAVYDAMLNEYRRLVLTEWNGHDRFGAWLERQDNNAALAIVGVYDRGLCAFDRLLRAEGGDFRSFHAAVEDIAGWPADERERWLAQRCE